MNEESAMAMLLEAMAVGSSRAIENQEKRGQTKLVQSEVLPIQMTINDKQALEKEGFIFGDEVNDLFVSVQFPTGWKMQATSHSMWSDLLDAKGRKRGSIFYKAAFYDRSAHMSLTKRYYISSYIQCDEAGNPTQEKNPSYFKTCVVDGSEPIKSFGIRNAHKDFAKADAMEAEARTWLDENYPNHRDPSAYWD